MCRPLNSVDFPEISLVWWNGLGDSGQVLVVRTALRQREGLLRSPCFYTMLTSAALRSGFAWETCQLYLLTSAPRGKMKSYLHVTIVVSITTVAGALINRNTNSRAKIKVLTWSWGGGFRLWWRHHRNLPLKFRGVFKWWRMMTRGGEGVKNAQNLMTSYVNDP